MADDEGLDLPTWWSVRLPLLSKETSSSSSSNSSSSSSKPISISELKHKAQGLLQNKADQGRGGKGQASYSKDDKWIHTILKSGTASDKTAALTVTVQSNPFLLSNIDSLLNMAQKKGRREAQMAMESLKELFISSLIPRFRSLKYFKQQPIEHPDVTDEHLLYWIFEEEIKTRYATFLSILEVGSKDTLSYFKDFVLKTIATLLESCPKEQTNTLVSLLVNKLGDPDRKLSSRVCFLLTKITAKRAELRLPVVKEVHLLIVRPNVSSHAQYYATVFLNQLIFTRDQPDLPNRIIDLYFGEFKRLHAKGELEGRALNAILIGLNRAFPFSSLPQSTFDEYFDTLFKIVHISSFNKSLQALLLLFQVMQTRTEIKDRFYRALYAKLLSREIQHSSRQPLFFHLLYKALKTDKAMSRVKAFIKRLLQISYDQNASFICATLLLISEIIKENPGLWTLIKQPEDYQENALLSLENKDKKDENKKENNKNKKEISKKNQDTKETKKKTSKHNDKDSDQDSDQDDNNDFDFSNDLELSEKLSLDEEDEEEDDQDKDQDKNKKEENKEIITKKLDNSTTKKQLRSNQLLKYPYDPLKRDPQFSKAEETCLWELTPLVHHFHPSVITFARTLLSGSYIIYESDPLEDFSLMNFLDRFAYKNPKSKKSNSIMKKQQVVPPKEQIRVNDPKFLRKEHIKDDEVFFYKFFKKQAETNAIINAKKKKRQKQKKKKKQGDEDVDFGEDKFDEEEEEFDTKKGSDEEDEEEEGGGDDDEEGEESEGEFNYSDLDEDDEDLDDEDEEEDGFNPHIFDDIDSDDEDVNDPSGKKKSGRKSGITSSSFASLEDFAHLLETSGSDYVGVSSKQANWESRRAGGGGGGGSKKRPHKSSSVGAKKNKNTVPKNKKQKTKGNNDKRKK